MLLESKIDSQDYNGFDTKIRIHRQCTDSSFDDWCGSAFTHDGFCPLSGLPGCLLLSTLGGVLRVLK